jgi:hypothetical protein
MVEEATIRTLKVKEAGESMSEGVPKLVVESLAFLAIPPIHGAGAKFYGRGGGPSGVGV